MDDGTTEGYAPALYRIPLVGAHLLFGVFENCNAQNCSCLHGAGPADRRDVTQRAAGANVLDLRHGRRASMEVRKPQRTCAELRTFKMHPGPYPPPRAPRTQLPSMFVTFEHRLWCAAGFRLAGGGVWWQQMAVREGGKKATLKKSGPCCVSGGPPPLPRAQSPPLGPARAWRAGRSAPPLEYPRLPRANLPRPPLDRPASPPPQSLTRLHPQHPDPTSAPAAAPSSRNARPVPSS
ncbi:hypothetical protein HYPSUDRAFT_210348 [Hypholoma sublateritium FD-334 SS-4]|uniref:Uncharacterized protein n=1 Tax=Hypholoma sublateritium (strain FD-334 SS-4) TaxID=945553 RepID=A0A0D2N055_HYPSF|nr:hypothetical protein HYPSUDRAFT_210348 [Hypholoma sublateritium FD-334 SS-4]